MSTARRGRDSDLRIRGVGLQARFVLSMSIALALILVLAGYMLFIGANRIAVNVQKDTLAEASRFTHEGRPYEKRLPGELHDSGVQIFPFTYGAKAEKSGTLYFYDKDIPGVANEDFELLVPRGKSVGRDLLKWIAVVMVFIVLVGAGVALWTASLVSRPVRKLIDDVRQIAKGDLQHKTHAVGAGEIELLARSIDRMTRDLSSAQAAQLELSIRERELEVAAGVREALLPLATPLVESYDVGAAFMSSESVGGDFHDFIERDDGRVGLLVCDVSGTGTPAALVGATARSYLRTELLRSDDVGEALKRVNRWLAADVRRGMFVTALYALIDPGAGRAQVACAGHKIPLLRYTAEDQNLRVVHPEGIALGFDKGPVFERRLEVVEVPIEPGDRLILTNSAPVQLENSEGRELGERAFYARLKKHATLDTHRFLKSMRRDLEQFCGRRGIRVDVSLVTIARESGS